MEARMRTPGERMNDAARRALNLVLADKQAALDQIVRDLQALEVAAARSKVELRFIQFCRDREPDLVPHSRERLRELEMELEALGKSLSYRVEQAEVARQQVRAFQEFVGDFRRELEDNAELRPAADASDGFQSTEAEAA